jgi:anti-sigma factor RsiW
MIAPLGPPQRVINLEVVRLIGSMETAALAVDPRRVANDLCPRAEELAAYVDGRLLLEELRLVQAHLLSCHRCWRTFREVLALKALSRGDRSAEGVSGGPVELLR